VKLPLFREIRNSAERPSVQRSDSVQPITLPPFISTRIVTILRPVRHNATGELHGPEKDLDVREEIRTSVLKTILGWLHMKSLSADQEVDKADYVLVLADEISEIDSGLVMNTSKAIALLSHDTQRRQAETLLAKKFEVFETVTAPFGPRKLATAVAACELAANLRQKEFQDVIAGSSPTRTGSDHPLIPPSVFLDGNRFLTPGNADELERSIRPEKAPRVVRFRNGIDKVRGSELKSDLGHNQYHSNSLWGLNGEEDLSGQNDLDAKLSHSARAGNGRLLLVDDNKINLSLLETYVKRLKRNLEYECAENGILALEAARKNALGFDIIFMDVSMPGMDGLEATREIRKLEKERVVELGEAAAPPPALIVALTGLANSRDKVDAFASGVDLFMTKPTKFKEIGKLIEEWCENGSRYIRARQNQIQDG
jgi:CheY-like chemotaxis protein